MLNHHSDLAHGLLIRTANQILASVDIAWPLAEIWCVALTSTFILSPTTIRTSRGTGGAYIDIDPTQLMEHQLKEARSPADHNLAQNAVIAVYRLAELFDLGVEETQRSQSEKHTDRSCLQHKKSNV